MRVLVVDNFRPDPTAPQRGQFVRDQVEALRRGGIEIEHASFPPGKGSYPRTVRALRRVLRAERFDVVHAHYGLSGWCALLAGSRPLLVTFHGTDVRHPIVGPISRRLIHRVGLVGAASGALFRKEGTRPGLPRLPGRSTVLPCGVDIERFRPRPRSEARRRLGLDPNGRYLFFPAAAGRSVKRHDLASELARRAEATLLTAGSIEPEAMPDWINAASAVVVPSDNEGFGLGVVEALACEVPVLATPVGVAPSLLRGLGGCLCAPFDPDRWSEFARDRLDERDPRVAGRSRAARYSARRMAGRVLVAYQHLAEGSPAPEAVAGPPPPDNLAAS